MFYIWCFFALPLSVTTIQQLQKRTLSEGALMGLNGANLQLRRSASVGSTDSFYSVLSHLSRSPSMESLGDAAVGAAHGPAASVARELSTGQKVVLGNIFIDVGLENTLKGLRIARNYAAAIGIVALGLGTLSWFWKSRPTALHKAFKQRHGDLRHLNYTS